MVSGSDPWQPGYPVDLRSRELVLRDAAGPYGDFEARAARVVARATGKRIVLQDDNRLPRTPDLRIENLDGGLGVGEVVTASDQPRAEQLVAFAKGELNVQSDRLRWTWWVTVTPNADRRGLMEWIVQALTEMEAADERYPLLGPIDPFNVSPGVKRLSELGVVGVACDPTPRVGVGQVIGLVEGIGGATSLDWDGFHTWLDIFLSDPVVRSKRDKLVAVASAEERHLFIGLSWSVPWAVLRVLEADVDDVPTRAPTAPDGVSHLWLYGAELPSRCLAWWPDRGWFDVARRWVTE